MNPWSLDHAVYPSVSHIQAKIKNKKRNYGATDDPLILAVNVHALEFSPIDHGTEVLSNPNGILDRRRQSRSTVTAVLSFAFVD